MCLLISHRNRLNVARSRVVIRKKVVRSLVAAPNNQREASDLLGIASETFFCKRDKYCPAERKESGWSIKGCSELELKRERERERAREEVGERGRDSSHLCSSVVCECILFNTNN